MTLDEAIRHCEEKSSGCGDCASEHRQLTEWLAELKFRRAGGAWMNDIKQNEIDAMLNGDTMRKYAEAHGCGELRIPKLTDEQIKQWQNAIEREPGRLEVDSDYPQAQENNEFRYLSPAWLDEIARGLTAGAQKYPGETWRQIPQKEHAWRAVRHLILYLKGDTQDTHLINASMRCMMAYETAAAEGQRDMWEKLMKETRFG